MMIFLPAGRELKAAGKKLYLAFADSPQSLTW